MSVFDPTYDQLPRTIPVFPLPEVLLLPRGRLPLNIFEPRYLAMVEDALAADRMIGVIQPLEPDGTDRTPDLYNTGCAGRICRFEETNDGRYLIALSGVCRFTVVEELAPVSEYRRVHAGWSDFHGDLDPVPEAGLDRGRLLSALRGYFDAQGIDADWDALREAPDERLVTCLSMICPFGASEKQALLEARDLAARTEVLMALIEMSGATCGPMRQ
jgi:Lon protease-like protein